MKYIKSDYDFDDNENDFLSYQDACEEYSFYDIENMVSKELGIYLDFSSIRGSEGTVMIFSDPTGEYSNCDCWLGPWENHIVDIDYGEYCDEVECEVLSYPEEDWHELYKSLLQSYI